MTPRPRQPVVFIPHGGGPWPFVDLGLPPDDVETLAQYLRTLPQVCPTPPRALLIVSAHWEEAVPTVSTSERPPMIYDYSGFPEASYRLQWPAPGDPALAAQVVDLLEDAGIPTATDGSRGYDHGTFIPMMLAFPDADTPTVQLSLDRSLDPAAHLRIGRALAPLRDDGVLIVGSGMSFHNLRSLRDRSLNAHAPIFDRWLQEVVTQAPEVRDAKLRRWSEAPSAQVAHPREEHLMPLMVVAGAAGDDRGTLGFSDTVFGWALTAAHFGVEAQKPPR